MTCAHMGKQSRIRGFQQAIVSPKWMEIHRVITAHNLGSLTDKNFHFSPWSQTKEETNRKCDATFTVIPRTQHNNHMTTLKCIPSKSSTLMDNKSPTNP